MRVHMKEKEEKFQMDSSSTQRALDCERVAHTETRLRWEVCHNRLEEEQKQHSVEQTRVSVILVNISVEFLYLKKLENLMLIINSVLFIRQEILC